MDEDIVQLVICLPELAETVTKNELVRHITCESPQLPASVEADSVSHWK